MRRKVKKVGKIVKDARLKLEQQTDKKVVNRENFLLYGSTNKKIKLK
jgi:ubiquitin